MDNETTLLAVWGALASGLTGAVKLYRLPAVQARLRPALQWDNLTIFGKIGLIVGSAAATSALTALSGGLSWGAAGAAAVVAATSAIGFDQVTDAGKFGVGVAREQGVALTLSRPSSLIWRLPADRDVVPAEEPK